MKWDENKLLSPFNAFELMQNKNCAERQETSIKGKNILTLVKNGKGDLIPDYCNRGEKSGSTLNTAQNEGISGWKITKREHQE